MRRAVMSMARPTRSFAALSRSWPRHMPGTSWPLPASSTPSVTARRSASRMHSVGARTRDGSYRLFVVHTGGVAVRWAAAGALPGAEVADAVLVRAVFRDPGGGERAGRGRRRPGFDRPDPMAPA